MKTTLITIRFLFFALCIIASALICYTNKEWDQYLFLAMFIGSMIGALVILVDVMLKGFSLRGLSALSFGLFIGWLAANFILHSPLFEYADEQTRYLSGLALFIVLMYLGAVIALRGKDEFNLVIPYVRFEPHEVESPLVVVDTSALIDGRIVGICSSKFLGHAIVIPRFILTELNHIADSKDPARQKKGRKGLDVINNLNKMGHMDIRIHESDVGKRQNLDAKLIFIAQSMNAKLLTTDYNLARMAEFHNVEWLNINALFRSLNPELNIGATLEVDLVKEGKEPGQAIGFLSDGSMVVINDGIRFIHSKVAAEIQSILPSAGGKMIFANMITSLENQED